MLTDSHCHLQADAFADDLDAVIQRAHEASVTRLVTIGWDAPSSRAAIALAEKYESVYATVGIAPHDETPFTNDTLKVLRDMAHHPKVVALGEFGLDYHYHTWPRETQQAIFERQLELASELAKPVVIHNRDADDDVLAILTQFAKRKTQDASPHLPLTTYPLLRGVMHCFSGTLDLAQACWSLGFLISIAGPITYPKPRALPEVVKMLPLNALLVETDAPFLAPQAWRGKRNEPAYARAVVAKIASLRGDDFETVAQATTRNAEKLFAYAQTH
jgi:TatD DNase family protein